MFILWYRVLFFRNRLFVSMMYNINIGNILSRKSACGPFSAKNIQFTSEKSLIIKKKYLLTYFIAENKYLRFYRSNSHSLTLFYSTKCMSESIIWWKSPLQSLLWWPFFSPHFQHYQILMTQIFLHTKMYWNIVITIFMQKKHETETRKINQQLHSSR